MKYLRLPSNVPMLRGIVASLDGVRLIGEYSNKGPGRNALAV